MQKSTLHLSSITKSFIRNKYTITILDNITASFVQGNTYAITGESGAGKSTLLHIIAGLDSSTKGTCYWNGIEAKQSNTFLGCIFQSPHLIKELSVIENVMLPGLIANRDSKIVKQEAYLLLEKVGLLSFMNSCPGELSGGQQQRVSLARALINKPHFLIADEPTGNLDIQTSKAVINLILDCQKKWGMGIIISSHDPRAVEKMDKVFMLKNGTLTEIENVITICSLQKKYSEKQYR